jgi:hypothetical protein
MATAAKVFEDIDVRCDARFSIETIDVASVHNGRGTANRVTEHAVELMYDAVQRLNGERGVRVRPDLSEQLVPGDTARLAQGKAQQ